MRLYPRLWLLFFASFLDLKHELYGPYLQQCCNEYPDLDLNLFLQIPNIWIKIHDFFKTYNIWIYRIES